MDCPWPGEEKAFDRIMYVFGCNSRLCTEGQGDRAWRVFVIQRAAKQVAVEASKKFTASSANGAGLWDKLMLSEPVSQVTGGLNEMTLADADEDDEEGETGIYETSYPVCFPATRLRIVEEMIQERAKKINNIISEEEIPAAFRATSNGESWDGEAYEKSICPPGYDKYFEKFQQRVSSYPRQCVRYSPGSLPLLYCKEETVGPKNVPACSECGRERQFEMQLMPAILSLLPTGEEKYLRHIPEGKRNSHPIYGDGMEWATLLLYSCGVCTRQSGIIQVSLQVQIEKE